MNTLNATYFAPLFALRQAAAFGFFGYFYFYFSPKEVGVR